MDSYKDSRWIECRVPGCHRGPKATIHSEGKPCPRCKSGGHPRWHNVGYVDRYSPMIKHHEYTPKRASATLFEFTATGPPLPGVVYD